ncbi:MAG: hypothetical protein A3F74_23125 [Betaproteobacteria bacterium RIFCSPLOWO2_12_FULL_62_58]|nr:MAG: hypothetical protein A3F74_23125 [Betaproteobacteria bacterium RIFCSPLOWO2_12_FULL_62_58]
MRTLIVIPIIHTEQDMGSLLEQIKQEYVTRYSREKWTEHLKSIDEVWSGIRRMIVALELPYASVRLYQDGLPHCGKEADIVKEVAARGSKNHQLLVELVEQGARLTGTEDPHLLLQEYQFLQGALGGAVPAGRQGEQGHENQREDQSRRLLAERDRFIAGRINATLSAGEIGLLFLGLAHSVEPLLDADILVRYLLPSLRERQGKGANRGHR